MYEVTCQKKARNSIVRAPTMVMMYIVAVSSLSRAASLVLNFLSRPYVIGPMFANCMMIVKYAGKFQPSGCLKLDANMAFINLNINKHNLSARLKINLFLLNSFLNH